MTFAAFTCPLKQAKMHGRYLNASFPASTVYLKLPSTKSFSTRATFTMITQDDSLPALLDVAAISQRTQSICAIVSLTRSYLFHVSVVHGVVRHLIRLQLDNLFELIAIAFPLADNDHFIKQEYVPKDTHIYS